jgi:pyruvyl transferase EpsO
MTGMRASSAARAGLAQDERAGAGAPAGGCPAPSRGVLVEALAREIERVLDPLVPAGGPVALLDFPEAPNVGDSMIWAGTLRYLARRGATIRYACSNSSWSPATLARRIGDGAILLAGGGNFGDLYPDHQELREAVIEAFPRHRIVQLPQSVHFESEGALERARRVIGRHRALTLLARDRVTWVGMRRWFDAPATLCPDMAFALGALPRTPAVAPVVWLARMDKESRVAHGPAPSGVERRDWLTDDRSFADGARHLLRRILGRWPRLRPLLQDPLAATYPAVAAERVERGRRILSRGRVVVSDRLHAHVLCLLLGIPHMVLDNTYGKVRALYDTWTHDSPLATWCDHEAEALERAVALAATLDGSARD